MPTVYLGIDPGASGGLAALCGSHAYFKTMPETERLAYDWLDSYIVSSTVAVIERVSGYIGQGQPGSAMFKFGMSYGALRMALVAIGLVEGETFFAVTPQAWQKALGITPRDNKRGESKSQWKGRLKAKAEELFPSLHVTLATADALLLAHYCRLRYGTNRN